MAEKDELVEEIQTYEAHLSEWAAHDGEYVLIRGSEIIDFFETYDKALSAGYEQFGLVPFLVKKVILKPGRAQFISRMVAPVGR